MASKDDAIAEVNALMRDFDIRPTRLGRDIMGDPNFVKRLKQRGTRITDITYDKIFKYAAELRGQKRLVGDG